MHLQQRSLSRDLFNLLMSCKGVVRYNFKVTFHKYSKEPFINYIMQFGGGIPKTLFCIMGGGVAS